MKETIKAKSIAIIALAAVTLVSGVATAQAKRETLNATTITTYPPFEFKDPATGKLSGFDIDILEAIATKIGSKVNWIESSFAQVVSFTSIKTKRADVAISALADTPERREAMNLLAYSYDEQVLFTLEANKANFPNMASLCGKKVAVTRSSVTMTNGVINASNETCVKAGKPAMVVVGTDGAPQSRLEVSQGRADVAVQGVATYVYQNGIEGAKYAIVGEPVARVTNVIAYAKDDAELGIAMKKALNDMIADGTYRKIMAKWNLPSGAAIQRPVINGEP